MNWIPAKIIVAFASITVLSACGDNDAAKPDLAACERQFPSGFLIDTNRGDVIECMASKGWKTGFLTGNRWWQSSKYARESGAYSR